VPPLLLIQPPAGGRISGGYLYNARMAEHGLWQLRDVPPEQLPTLHTQLPAEQPLLLDSIWLTEAHAPAFDRLSAGGRTLGVMLHSLPSLITAAESGRAAPSGPSAFERERLERLGLVLVPGRHYADLLAGCRTRIVIAEPGIDDGWRAAPRHRQGPCRLVSVGAATPRKGFLDVAEVLRELDPADYEWRVLGSLDVDREYAGELARRTASLPGVQLLGQQPPAEVQRLVRSSDVLVMPSYDENQPLVLVEAMAASVPSVAYAAGAARHMLAHGREGFITEIGDRPALALALRRLLEQEDLRLAMANACWERQASIPSWPQAVARARALLTS